MSYLAKTVGYVLIPGLLTAVGASAQVEFSGDAFQVNATTTADQGFPDVALVRDGRSVVVWESDTTLSGGTDTAPPGIVGQRFGSDGALVGDEFQVNSFTSGSQGSPRVAADADGNFVVVWRSAGSAGSDADGFSVQGRRFGSDGTPLATELQVNAYTTGDQLSAAVAMSAVGDFLVVWESAGSAGSDSDNKSIQGQRFGSDGSAVGGQFQVNTYTTSLQESPGMAFSSDGGFMVVWSSFEPLYAAIRARRFASDGTALDSDFLVEDPAPAEDALTPDVAIDPDGRFVVVWHDNYFGDSSHFFSYIRGRTYDEAAQPVGEFTVESNFNYDFPYLNHPSIGLEPGGTFVVSWVRAADELYPLCPRLVEGRRVDFQGTVIGDRFQVHQHTTEYDRFRPAMAGDGIGDFVIVWHADGSPETDSSGDSIHARRFSKYFFADGFESGDTSRWTLALP